MYLFLFLPSSSLSDRNPEFVIAVPRKVLEGVNNHLEVLLTRRDQLRRPETPTQTHKVGEHLLVLEAHDGVLVIIEVGGTNSLQACHHHIFSSVYFHMSPIKIKAWRFDLVMNAWDTWQEYVVSSFLTSLHPKYCLGSSSLSTRLHTKNPVNSPLNDLESGFEFPNNYSNMHMFNCPWYINKMRNKLNFQASYKIRHEQQGPIYIQI